MKIQTFAAPVVLTAVLAVQSRADVIPYAPVTGTPIPGAYTFTAIATGDIIAYFAGSTATFENELGLLVNGVDTGIYGLNNMSSAIGLSLNFGPVTAGDTLVFVLRNLTGLTPAGQKVYSDPSLNGPYDSYNSPSPGLNHVYATPYTATAPIFAGIPVGTYVSFEDLPATAGSDWNYNDEDFVFANVAVPEPATLALAGLGVAGLVAYRRRTRGEAAAK